LRSNYKTIGRFDDNGNEGSQFFFLLLTYISKTKEKNRKSLKEWRKRRRRRRRRASIVERYLEERSRALDRPTIKITINTGNI